MGSLCGVDARLEHICRFKNGEQMTLKRNLMLLAVTALVGTSLLLPGTALATWTVEGKEIEETAALELDGKLKFETKGWANSIECEFSGAMEIGPESQGSMTSFQPEFDKCQTGGALAGCTSISATAQSLPWPVAGYWGGIRIEDLVPLVWNVAGCEFAPNVTFSGDRLDAEVVFGPGDTIDGFKFYDSSENWIQSTMGLQTAVTGELAVTPAGVYGVE